METVMFRSTAAIVATAFLGVATCLGGCAGPTPYQPSTSLQGSGGYSEQRLAADRYRVTFAGNSMTSRETVENYLLYRAAELTAQQGYEWFIMADRDVERDRRVVVDRAFNDGRWGYWGPRWRYWGAGFGWRSWDPFYGDPFWANSVDVRTIERYEATAEIVMRRDPPRDGDLRVFRAREVLENLGPNIQRPT
jgi:hypothetical protein